MAAPTQSAVSATTIAAGTRTTGSVSWNSGDIVLVLGMTGDSGTTLGTPSTTGTGLSFAALTGSPTTTGSRCKGYGWSATASATSSGTISCTQSGSPSFIVAFVYSGSDGIGAVSISAALGSTSTQNLTRGQANSAVADIWGDWNAVEDEAVTWTPTGQTQHVASNVPGAMTGFSASWGDQGATGTTAYGFSGFAAGQLTALTVEIKGTAGATDFEGTGALSAQAAAVAGAGLHGRTSTGTLAAQSSAVAGAAVVGRTGTGALAAQAAAIAGTGVVGRTATGGLILGDATIAGSGVVGRVGTGTLSADSATISGAAIVGEPPSDSAIRNFSLREWRQWHRPDDDRKLEKLGVSREAAEVLSRVVERQVEDLHLDEQQRLEELTRELELEGIQWDGRYLKLLNDQRSLLIDAEIGEILRKRSELQSQEEASILLLLMTV